MAETLIETYETNPYESYVMESSSNMSSIDDQIERVSSAISNLERISPTSTILPQLRERLAELQSKREGYSKQNDSAKSLMEAYNTGKKEYNTLQAIYDLKEAQLAKAKAEADIMYDQMYSDTKKNGDNYVNALGLANASENAIINSSAGRQGASMQSTAEARARNYLNNAQAQREAAVQTNGMLNDIRNNQIANRNGLLQMSQGNADNYLRQQILTDLELAENERNRQFQKEMQDAQIRASRSGGSGGTSQPSTTDQQILDLIKQQQQAGLPTQKVMQLNDVPMRQLPDGTTPIVETTPQQYYYDWGPYENAELEDTGLLAVFDANGNPVDYTIDDLAISKKK